MQANLFKKGKGKAFKCNFFGSSNSEQERMGCSWSSCEEQVSFFSFLGFWFKKKKSAHKSWEVITQWWECWDTWDQA